MAIASGTRVELAYIEEVTRNVTPNNPTLKLLRATSRNVNPNKNILESAEVRSDRQKSDVRHGLNTVTGSVGAELSITSYNDMIRYAMGGAWTAVSISGTPAFGSTAPSTFTRSTGSFVTDGVRPGDVITTGGFSAAANNGKFIVVAVAATSLTVATPAAAPLVTEVAGSQTLIIKGKRIDIGTTLTTFTLERRFTDIGQYQAMRGVAVNQMSLSIKPEAIVTSTFDLIGMSFDPASGTSITSNALTPAPTTSPLASFDGAIVDATGIIAVITGLDITLNNNRTTAGVVGSKFSPDVFEGTADVTGTVTAYFQNAVLLNKFINETESAIFLRLDDIGVAGDFMGIAMPRVKYNGGTIDPPQSGPVPISLPFRALVPTAGGSCLSIQASDISA